MPSVGEAPQLRRVSISGGGESPPRVLGFFAPVQPSSASSDEAGKHALPISPLSQALRSEQAFPRLTIRKPARGQMLGRKSFSFPDLQGLEHAAQSSLNRSASGSLRSEPVAIPSRRVSRFDTLM